MMAFLQLSVLSRYPEFVEEILLANGAASVSFVDAADDPVLEPAPGETPLWPRTRTIGLYDRKTGYQRAIAALRATLPDNATVVITAATLRDREWVRVWLKDWEPLRFGKHLWVSPHEKTGEVRDRKAIIVALDPGLAFGTGTHPTTALCLDWLAGAKLKGKAVLDFGCGSGILSVAALKLGAKSAVGVDIDPQAVKAARDNARANGVGRRLKATLAADFHPARHDLIVANILAQPLLQLAPLLASCARPGGTLVMSGLLLRHVAEVRAAYRGAFEFERPSRRAGWVRLVGRRRAD